MQSSGSPQLDLTGKLIIKVALGDDIRRIPIHNEEITYDELVLMMQRVYRGKLSTNDEITIKYKDEDGDLITIFDSSDLTFAIQCSRILKITLFVGGHAPSVLEPMEAAMMRAELQGIRDRVVGLLDKLGSLPTQGAPGLARGDACAAAGVNNQSQNASLTSRPLEASGGKEFDPLTSQKSLDESQQSKVMNSFGMDGNVSSSTQQDRAATPDSISSVGSSASRMQNQHQQSSSVQQQPQQQYPPQQLPQQQPPQQQPPQQQPPPQQPAQQQPAQQQMQPGNQAGYQPQQQPGQVPQQAYPGQSAYGSPQPPQGAAPGTQQSHPHQGPPPQQQFDPAAYGQYPQGYGAPAPGQAPPGQMMYAQPYGQAPGMPQVQPKAPGYPSAPGQSPGNPYSRNGPGYGAGYPRPSAGYPQ